MTDNDDCDHVKAKLYAVLAMCDFAGPGERASMCRAARTGGKEPAKLRDETKLIGNIVEGFDGAMFQCRFCGATPVGTKCPRTGAYHA